MEELTAHIYASRVPAKTLPPYSATRCYWIGSAEAILLVDTGDGGEAGRAVLERDWEALGRPPLVGIVVTHYHLDHRGGAAWASGRWHAPVYLHPLDRARFAEGEGLAWEAPPASLTVGEVEVTLFHAPGHTPGQVNVWVPDDRVLLAGDNVLGNSTVVIHPPDGDLGQYLVTLERLSALKPDIIGPGHGDLVRNAATYLHYYLDHRRERNRQILALLDDGPKSAEELARIIYRNVLPAEHMALGVAMVEGHLAWCQALGWVAPDGERYRRV
ncbi:MAG: MBL fold metallo-hydrolase [Firmicutes bacterium]|nr:MBL fold metallo-hydrolase [Bacillota bacterium]